MTGCMRNGILHAVNNKFINIVIFYLLINELSKEDFSLLYFCVFGCEFINLVHFLALLLGFEVKFLLSKGGLVNLTEILI